MSEPAAVSQQDDALYPSMPTTDKVQTLFERVNSRSSPHILLDLCCGSHRPLSRALLALGADVLSIDKLFNLNHDLLNCDFMESLLRVCSSGVVGYTAASPSCNEYSRLKLKPNVPKSLPTPTYLQGIPTLTPSHQSYSESRTAILCYPIAFRLY